MGHDAQMIHRCGQCGSTDLIALPMVYEQGTRSFSGRFTSGISQSMSARAAAPPRAKRYLGPLIVWGLVSLFFAMWTYIGFSVLPLHPKDLVPKAFLAVAFAALTLAAFARLIWAFRRAARYNHETYPQLYADWESTFQCRRCGHRSLIRP